MHSPTAATALLDVFVYGTPRPKGSMRHVGHGRLVEQIAGSPDWRRAVAEAAYTAIGCACADGHPNCGTTKPGYPYTGPVEVHVRFLFNRPKSAKPDAMPSTRATGDVDKLLRNVYDALQDAGVIRDDAQVVDDVSSKRYAGPGQMAGARIAVFPAAVRMRVIVTGSRTWTDPAPVRAWLDRLMVIYGSLTVVYGGAGRGADAIASSWCAEAINVRRWRVEVERYPADWKGLGQRAGILRNIDMVKAGADLCLAFICPCEASRCIRPEPHGSHGATHCAGIAEQAGIETRVMHWEDREAVDG